MSKSRITRCPHCAKTIRMDNLHALPAEPWEERAVAVLKRIAAEDRDVALECAWRYAAQQMATRLMERGICHEDANGVRDEMIALWPLP